MVISDRLRAIREQKDLSQGDMEKRTGLLRCYVSRVENGHTVPSIGTLEKMARALEVPHVPALLRRRNAARGPNAPKGPLLRRRGMGERWRVGGLFEALASRPSLQ